MKSYDTYVYSSASIQTLMTSSSGGVFYNLAVYFLSNNGVVYASGLESETGRNVHRRISDINQVDNCKKAKYVFSNIGNSFSLCKKDLLEGKKVLFVGTPCQIASLKTFLNAVDITNLVTIDFICHGCPKPMIWLKYLSFLGAKPPYDIDFRFKKVFSWEKYWIKINDFEEEASKNLYMNLFLKNYILLDSCYSCKFKGDNHVSDLTIGDAWGVSAYAPKSYNPKGTSLLICRNHFELLDILKTTGDLNKVIFNDAIAKNKSYYEQAQKPTDYKKVNKLISRNKFSKLFKPKRSILKNLLKPLLKIHSFYFFKSRPKKQMVGIVTNYAFNKYNFGNRLQNFALSEKIKEQGFKPANILIGGLNGPSYPLERFYRNFTFFQKNKSKRNYLIKKSCRESGIKEAWINNAKREINKIFMFPKIIYGGDQIWNPCWEPFKIRLGEYCVDTSSIKKESFSPSICVYSKKDEHVEAFRQVLGSFRHVSVREIDAKDYLNGIGIDSTVVLDPVLLMDEKEWKSYIKKYSRIKLPEHKYSLHYFLGKQGTEFRNNTEIIDILDKKSEYYNINHFDFINLILNAENVVTDSYHALLFSIIFKKRFMICNRDNDNNGPSRFTSIFKLLNIKYQIGKDTFFDNYESISSLEDLINDSKQYLINILND